jgi:hypothetical protein
MSIQSTNVSVSDGKARRAAKERGFLAIKRRWRRGTVDNFGGFMLIEPRSNCVVAGARFDLSPEDVVKYCKK